MSAFTYSAGGRQECFHDENGRFAFPKEQHLYGRSWDLVVTDLAEHFHSHHDGWESDWPAQFRIYEDGTELARFLVEREMEPTFYASEQERADPRAGDQVARPQTEAGEPVKPSEEG